MQHVISQTVSSWISPPEAYSYRIQVDLHDGSWDALKGHLWTLNPKDLDLCNMYLGFGFYIVSRVFQVLVLAEATYHALGSACTGLHTWIGKRPLSYKKKALSQPKCRPVGSLPKLFQTHLNDVFFWSKAKDTERWWVFLKDGRFLWKMLGSSEGWWVSLKDVGFLWKMVGCSERCWVSLKDVGFLWKMVSSSR